MQRDKDMQRFVVVMATLGEVFEKDPSEAKAEIYFQALEDLPIESVEQAASAMLKARVTASFPKPAEFRQALEGDGQDAALVALSIFRNSMKRIGSYQDVVFEDQVISDTCHAMGGWIACCTELDWDYAKHEFVKFYQAFKTHPSAIAPKLLSGIFNLQNSQTYPDRLAPPKLVKLNGEIQEKTMIGSGERLRITGEY